VARRFDEEATAVRDLRRRVPLIEEAMQSLDARLRAVEDIRPRADVHGTASADLTTVCRMFVHSRLPPPPATVLVLPGVDAGIAGDLHALGYIIQSSPDTEADVVIASLDERASAAHAIDDARLRPQRRALLLALATPAREPVSPARVADRAVRGWRVEEWLVAADDSWNIVGAPDSGDKVLGVVMVRQGPGDAPRR
jgi:hypothetical protein